MEDAKLTHSTDEFDLDSILGGDCIFSIPYFQREYKWNKTQLKELVEDIDQIVSKEEDVHFFGALILYSRPTPAGRSKTLEVVDGQQRITTIILILAALVEQFCILKKYDDAEGLFSRYLFLGRKPKELSNLKLHPSKEDRNQFNNIIFNLTKDETFFDTLGKPKINALPSTGPESGKIDDQYKLIKKWLDKKRVEGGFPSLDAIYQVLVKGITSVQIILKDPTACSRIFERLNYRGVKVNIGDLVRNEIFSKVAEQPQSNIEAIHSIHWEPFYTKFTNHDVFESYFFPFGIIKKPSLGKNEVFDYLRTEWAKIDDPEKIIFDLKIYQDIFLFLKDINSNIELPLRLKGRLKEFVASKFSSAIYPFIMRLIRHFQERLIDEFQVIKIINLIDSFLTRRAICGIEPTGLHSAFKDLWEKVKPHPTLENISSQIRLLKTVAWPNDEEFKIAIVIRPLFGSSITSYFILQYDKSLKGDTPSDKPTIEHILPKSYEQSKWGKSFSKSDHEKFANTLANLIPLSPPQNNQVGQKTYEEKKKNYSRDSMYKTPRHVANKYPTWNKDNFEKRGEELAQFALKRWPYS